MASRTTSPGPSCTWPATEAATSPVPRSRSTAVSPPDRAVRQRQVRSPPSIPTSDPGCSIPAMNPLSGVLDEAWRMYKTFAKHLLVIAFVIYLGAAIIEGLLALAGTFGFWFGFVVSVVALFLLQATLVKAVQDVRDGRADMSISETVSAALPYLG